MSDVWDALYSSNISDICEHRDPVPHRPDDYPLDAVDLALEDADELSVTHLLVHLIAIEFIDLAPPPARGPLQRAGRVIVAERRFGWGPGAGG